ncbi:hypothetical protein R6Q57_022894 [Mikania cordata]
MPSSSRATTSKALNLPQPDFKPSLVVRSHMGFILIGIASITDTELNGAILQIISHGFIDTALFFLAGTSYDRIRLVYLNEMGGVAIPMPKMFTMFSSFSMASLALLGPGWVESGWKERKKPPEWGIVLSSPLTPKKVALPLSRPAERAPNA